MIPETWVWIDCECPNCTGKFLYAEGRDPEGTPMGEMRCASCGHQFLEAVDVQPAEQMFLEVADFEIASWSPGKDGEGIPPTQVHVLWRVPDLNLTLLMRLKSRAVCDSFIAALIEHRDFVYGKPQEGG